MAATCATPLEKQFSTIAGLDSMTSTNGLGITKITLQFNLSRNIDAAAQDVQTAIATASSQLPQNIPTPPTFRKVNPADWPILYIAMSTSTLPLSTVDEYAENLLAQRISMISGVAEVMVYGSQQYAVHARLDPKALASRGIGIDEVASAIASGNVNIPTGTLWGTHQAFTVQATGQLNNAAASFYCIVLGRGSAYPIAGARRHSQVQPSKSRKRRLSDEMVPLQVDET